MTSDRPAPPHATVHLLHDPAELHALRGQWQALEAAAPVLSLYDTHDYLCTVWAHRARPGDRLFVWTLRRAGDGALLAAWPLVRRTTRRFGLPHHELRPLAIWEGERPRLLSRLDAAATDAQLWPLLWQALMAQRAHWHTLVLPELDPGCWLLRQGALAQPGRGLTRSVQADTVAPWQAIDGAWASHAARRPAAAQAALTMAWQALAAHLPGWQVTVHDRPDTIVAAFERYLHLDRLLHAQQPAAWVTLSQDDSSAAFYRDWLPRLAAQGAASIHLLGDGARDVAGLIRLRCRGLSLERHACHDPGFTAQAPATLLLVDALQRSFAPGSGLAECDAVNLPAPPGPALHPFTWLDGRRATQRLRVVNLQGLQGLATRLRQVLRR